MRSCLSFHLYFVLIQCRTYYPFALRQQLVGVLPLDCQRSCLSPMHSYFLIESCNRKCYKDQNVNENKGRRGDVDKFFLLSISEIYLDDLPG